MGLDKDRMRDPDGYETGIETLFTEDEGNSDDGEDDPLELKRQQIVTTYR